MRSKHTPNIAVLLSAHSGLSINAIRRWLGGKKVHTATVNLLVRVAREQGIELPVVPRAGAEASNP